MRSWQVIRDALPDEVDVERTPHEDEVRIRVGHIGPSVLFRIAAVDVLTRSWLDETSRSLRGNRIEPLIVLYAKASEEARAALRKAGISYVGELDGRLLLMGRGLHVERDELRSPEPLSYWPSTEESQTRNPYALRASRIPRWLLLHPHERFTATSLAASVELSESVVSRTLRALDDDAVVEVRPVADDARMRSIQLTRPRALLGAWARAWEHRRLQQVTWDVGAHDDEEALRILASASDGPRRGGWMLGGLAGAARMRRAVEPSDVLVWASEDEVHRLAAIFKPRVQSRARLRGTLRIAVVPDAWTLTLAQHIGGVPVADPVQLWLDCATEGERALEAAEAIARVMGW